MLLSAEGGWSKTPNRYQRLMIRPVFISLSVAAAIFLTSCESDQPQKSHSKVRHSFGYNDEQQTQPGGPDTGVQPAPGAETPDNGGPIAPPPAPPGAEQKKPETPPAPNGATNAAPNVAKKDYPYAQPVPGKSGFVTSPYAPYSGYVDVRGFPPGTEVKDPYTQKVFLVP